MPTSITFPADSTADLHGFNAGVFRLPVVNSGSTPLRVTGSVATLTPRAKAHPAASWITVDRGQLDIAPHHTGYLTIRVHVPGSAGVQGVRFANIIARAEPASHSGQVRETSGVGGTLRITHAGHKAPPAPPVAPVDHGTPWLPLLGLLVLLALAAGLAVGAWWLRGRRVRRAQRSWASGAARRDHPASGHARHARTGASS